MPLCARHDPVSLRHGHGRTLLLHGPASGEGPQEDVRNHVTQKVSCACKLLRKCLRFSRASDTTVFRAKGLVAKLRRLLHCSPLHRSSKRAHTLWSNASSICTLRGDADARMRRPARAASRMKTSRAKRRASLTTLPDFMKDGKPACGWPVVLASLLWSCL